MVYLSKWVWCVVVSQSQLEHKQQALQIRCMVQIWGLITTLLHKIVGIWVKNSSDNTVVT